MSSDLESKPCDPEVEEIVVARVRKTQGRRGEVAAEILTDFPERFQSLARVRLIGADGTASWRELEAAWLHKQAVILKFSGVDSITAAEALIGAEVRIPRSQAVPLSGNAHYVFELVGCDVVEDESGRRIGRVEDVTVSAGQHLLAVDTGQGEALIPFVEEMCRSIDVPHREIRVRLPEGLLELNAKNSMAG